ncbi:hypothetical protein C8J57DRAFT_1244668 [Mycena rebaudengoi]|nr:hypothetical protein C8J57DRAFT_1244668 [Mycena rebaudengoi]
MAGAIGRELIQQLSTCCTGKYLPSFTKFKCVADSDVLRPTWLLSSRCPPFNLGIPPAPGAYPIRHEIIALHLADQPGGAECAQPEELVSLPGAYNDTDPGILVDVFDGDAKPYTFSGPPIVAFVSSSSNSGNSNSGNSNSGSNSGGSGSPPPPPSAAARQSQVLEAQEDYKDPRSASSWCARGTSAASCACWCSAGTRTSRMPVRDDFTYFTFHATT